MAEDTGSNVAGYVQAAAIVGGVVANIIDAKKQREFQEKFAAYSLAQQMALADRIQAQANMTDKLAVLSKSIVEFDIENAKTKSRKDNIMYIIIGGMALLILGSAIYVSSKKKS